MSLALHFCLMLPTPHRSQQSHTQPGVKITIQLRSPASPAPAPELVPQIAKETSQPLARASPEIPSKAPQKIANEALPDTEQFHREEELNPRPKFITPPLPNFPEFEHHIKGHILLELFISSDGEVVSVHQIESSLPPSMTALAIAEFKNLRFVAGKIQGEAVKSRLTVEYTYDNGKIGK